MAIEVSAGLVEFDVEVEGPADIDVTPVAGAVVVVVPSPGIPGPQGSDGGTVRVLTASALGGHRVVVPNDVGAAEYADCTNVAHVRRPFWLTAGAWDVGVLATLVSDGIVSEPSWAWTPGNPVFLGTLGNLTQSVPVDALFVLVVAEVVNETTLAFRPGAPIILSS